MTARLPATITAGVSTGCEHMAHARRVQALAGLSDRESWLANPNASPCGQPSRDHRAKRGGGGSRAESAVRSTAVEAWTRRRHPELGGGSRWWGAGGVDPV